MLFRARAVLRDNGVHRPPRVTDGLRARGAQPRRLPRRPPPALAAARAATAPPSTRCCSPPSSRRARASGFSTSAAAPAPRPLPRRAGAGPRPARARDSSRPMPSSRGATPPPTASPLTVHEGDLRRPPAALRAAGFDQVLANPPFHVAEPPSRRGRCRPRPRPSRGERRHARRLDRRRPSPPACPAAGSALIHRPERLGEILAPLGGRGRGDRDPSAGAARRPAGGPAAAARPQGQRGAPDPLVPLTLHEGSAHAGDGSGYTAAVRRCCATRGAVAGRTLRWYQTIADQPSVRPACPSPPRRGKAPDADVGVGFLVMAMLLTPAVDGVAKTLSAEQPADDDRLPALSSRPGSSRWRSRGAARRQIVGAAGRPARPARSHRADHGGDDLADRRARHGADGQGRSAAF